MISRNFFSKCIDIERTIEAIYLYWSELDCYSPERREMWAKLSQDEEGHALDLEFASRLAAKNDIAAVSIDVSVLDKLQGHLNDLLVKIKKQPFTDAQAVKVAVDVEAQTMCVHARTALLFSDPELKRLFASLGTYDEKHLAGLTQAYNDHFSAQPTAMLQGGVDS